MFNLLQFYALSVLWSTTLSINQDDDENLQAVKRPGLLHEVKEKGCGHRGRPEVDAVEEQGEQDAPDER